MADRFSEFILKAQKSKTKQETKMEACKTKMMKEEDKEEIYICLSISIS